MFLRRDGGITERPINELADEPTWAAGVLAGRRPSQFGRGEPWDVFDAKALALIAIRAVAGDIVVKTRATASVGYLHPGVAGELVHEQTVVGWFGEVHPETRKRLGLPAPAFAFDLDLTQLPLARPPQMKPIPKFPGTSRDVSMLLADSIPAARVQEIIEAASDPLVEGAWLLEDYRDKALAAEHKKSMLWRVAYRAPDRTLTDAEVDKAHEAIVARLVETLPAQRR